MSYLHPAASTLSLAVNLAPVAALRDAGRSGAPDLLQVARSAIDAGADCVVLPSYLQDVEIAALARDVTVRLAMDADPAALPRVLDLKPQQAWLDDIDALAIAALHEAGIATVVCVDAESHQIDLAAKAGARMVELRSWPFISGRIGAATELTAAIRQAAGLGLCVSLGQGIDFINAAAFAAQPDVGELHIGHALAARAFEAGWAAAVREMLALMHRARTARKA